MNILYYTSKVLGTKKIKGNMAQLHEAVQKCEEIGALFEHFTKNEWIFDNQSVSRVSKLLSEEEKQVFNFDVSRIKWKMFVMNHAYGIKKFILKEEAELPSVGYNDVITVLTTFINLIVHVKPPRRELPSFWQPGQSIKSGYTIRGETAHSDISFSLEGNRVTRD